jgi:hypothetical protein
MAIVANIIAAKTSATAIDLIMRLMSATSSFAEGGTRQPPPGYVTVHHHDCRKRNCQVIRAFSVASLQGVSEKACSRKPVSALLHKILVNHTTDPDIPPRPSGTDH